MRNIPAPDKNEYIESLFANEGVALGEVILTLRDDEKRMQISPVEGKILHTLVRMIGAERIVEIGTLGGYSAIWMARALPEKGKLYAIESDYKKESRILNNFAHCGVSSKTELLIGRGNDVLPKLVDNGPFDVVFIDADKANYVNYLEWAEQNVRKGGLIIGDNTFLFGAVYGDNSREMPEKMVKVMQEFNRRLADSEKYTSVIMPTAEGLTVAMKEF